MIQHIILQTAIFNLQRKICNITLNCFPTEQKKRHIEIKPNKNQEILLLILLLLNIIIISLLYKRLLSQSRIPITKPSGSLPTKLSNTLKFYLIRLTWWQNIQHRMAIATRNKIIIKNSGAIFFYLRKSQWASCKVP